MLIKKVTIGFILLLLLTVNLLTSEENLNPSERYKSIDLVIQFHEGTTNEQI